MSMEMIGHRWALFQCNLRSKIHYFYDTGIIEADFNNEQNNN